MSERVIEMSVSGGLRWLPCPAAGVERAYGRKALTEILAGALFRNEHGHLVRVRPAKVARVPVKALPGDDGNVYAIP